MGFGCGVVLVQVNYMDWMILMLNDLSGFFFGHHIHYSFLLID